MTGGCSGDCARMRAAGATAGGPQPYARCDCAHDTEGPHASARAAAPRAPGALGGYRLPRACVGPVERPSPHRSGARFRVRRVARRVALRPVCLPRLAADLARAADVGPRDRDVGAVSDPERRSAAAPLRPPHRRTPGPSRSPLLKHDGGHTAAPAVCALVSRGVIGTVEREILT